MEKLILSFLYEAAGRITDRAALYSQRYTIAYDARHQIAHKLSLMPGNWESWNREPTGSKIEDRWRNRLERGRRV